MLREEQKVFLQACANHGTLAVSQAKKIIIHLSAKYDDNSDESEPDINEYITEINKYIRKYDQEIKTVKHELIGQDFIVFTNIAEAEINKFQSHYTETDRTYFRMILREIALSDEFCLQPIVVLNLTNELQVKKFTKNHAEELLQEWCDLGYLLEKDNLFYFGPKVIAEFGSYLKTHYSDRVNVCSLCKQIIFWPNNCEKCDTPFHRECIRKYLIKMSKCPSCQAAWNQRLD